METKVFVTNEQYKGQYVAFKSFLDQTIVGNGKNPEEIVKTAELNGFLNVVLAYIPEENVVNI
jgi:hypothetical protein